MGWPILFTKEIQKYTLASHFWQNVQIILHNEIATFLIIFSLDTHIGYSQSYFHMVIWLYAYGYVSTLSFKGCWAPKRRSCDGIYVKQNLPIFPSHRIEAVEYWQFFEDLYSFQFKRAIILLYRVYIIYT